MSDNQNEQADSVPADDASEATESVADTSGGNESAKSKTTTGVQWEQKPDPMESVKKGADSVKKGANTVLDSMEGKTVSMKTYVGSIIGVIILMMLARCGG